MKKQRKIFLLLLTVCLYCTQLFAQQNPIHIQGTVYDQLNDAVPGVNVFVKDNPSVGTVTNIDGNFSLKASVGDVLVFTFIGYENIEHKVTASDTNLSIRLKDSSEFLDEVVVVGYGVQKKSVISSAVSRVTTEELDRGNPTNVQNALKGKVSGVQITSNSGQPGSDSKIRIRGTGTVNNTDPLYIIDGMPSESGINHINPSDIESIEILKDAASAAIYGARGANGVVLVTTKKGTKGKASLSYEFTYGIQNPSKKIDLLGSADYQMLMNEMAANTPGRDPYFPTPSTVDTDWQDVLKNKNAPIINHKVSLSGGGENSTYYASFGYVKQEGIFAKGHSDYERYNFRLNYNNVLLDTKERNWLNKVSFNAIVNYAKEIKTGNNIGNSEAGGLMSSMNMLPPTESVYQTDPATLARYESLYPNHVKSPDGQVYNIIDMNDVVNPLARMQVEHNQRRIPQTFGANFSLDATLLPGLTFKTSYSNDWVFQSLKNVIPVYELNSTSKNANSRVEDEKRESSSWQWENVLSYTQAFGKHNIGALVGTTMSSYNYSNLKGTDYDLLVVDIDKGYIDTATAAEEMSKVEGGARDHRIASVFGRVNYNYDEKYLFEAVVRRDGSSNFGRKHQYATFPSVSAGWVLTREKFMENRPSWLDFAKIRFSWGQNGNENMDAFKYTSMMTKSGLSAVEAGKVYTGMKPAGYVNEDIKWETSEQTDLGIDLRFFNNALTFSADYFIKKTKDMLLNLPIPMYSGYGKMWINQGTVENKGVEFEASYRFNVGQVKFNVGGNASYIKNTVTDQGDDRIGLNSIGGGMGGQVSYSENGRPYGFFYGYVHDGIFQNWDEINNYKTEDGKLKQPKAQPGDIRFKDLDGKDGINGDDRTMIGKPNPDWTYGFNLNAEWKNFDISAFFQGTVGNDIYKLYRRSNVTKGNFDESWLGRWHGEGTSNWVPRIIEGDSNNYQVSSFFVEDGSYMRLKVAQIGYTLPTSLTKKAFIQKARVFVQGENLFTITDYSGYDPEVGTRDGFDGGTFPQSRTFTIGANIVF
ncbi:TonB-dependent receptor [Bacteroides sp. 51]|uniref:SusC/RagA family TonB-linked outer membrane protein n=1 Tax=Bacteroides sp. 51 TaxID=2302938 RepID=UPI0013D3CD5B|nr:TonB-dependent receptor [Bacteroides sp. 51]NDV83234.1 TonB-dependent receptor [Bacteroides sp. 51]